MRIALAQINPTVGAFAANAAKIRDFTQRAKAQGARLIVFPELCLAGYPPRDLLELPQFLREHDEAMESLIAPAEWSRSIAIALGWLERHEGAGAGLFNAALLIEDGRVLAGARKALLPTYDVFDEGRYFDAGAEATMTGALGFPLGVALCEDVWNDKAFWRRTRYPRDPVEELAARGAKALLNLSASPYALGKPQLREAMLGAAARRHGVTIVFVNQVGGNDALLFDGRSAVFGPDGSLIARAKGFEEELLIVDLDAGGAVAPRDPPMDELTQALVMGIRDYARKSGPAFSGGAVLGLSGGIDSALVACLAARAFEPSKVLGVAMPSRFSADISLVDAQILAKNLGIEFQTIPIEAMHQSFLEALAPSFAGFVPDTTEENLQSRIRGTLLMAQSNKRSKLLFSTGNKSELSMGYCTLYGDMAGALAPLGDLFKTTIFALAEHVNREREIIPWRTIRRAPTAELRENQKDEDSLPPYPVLDAILRAYVEERRERDAIVAMGFEPAIVDRILRSALRNEYKRRQAAPALRVSQKAFGEGWRFPMAHGFLI